MFVAGGNNGTDDLATAEVIDPVAGTSSTVGSMSQPRRGHQATLLDHNATVLIVGGTNSGAIVTTAETFVPVDGSVRGDESTGGRAHECDRQLDIDRRRRGPRRR